MSTKRKVLLGAGVVLLLGVLIYRALGADRRDAVQVRAEEVGRRDLVARVTATGHIEPKRSVEIRSDISGRIVRLPVEEGQDVEEGDLLLEIDPTQYRAAVRQATARLAEARSREARARADYLQAQRDWKRMEKLKERTPDLVTDQEAEQARTQAEVRESQWDAARHAVQQAEAALEEARDRLDKTVIRAPMTGRITRLNVEQGETAIVGTMNNPGSLLLTVADLSVMEAVVEVDETDVTQVQVDDSASVEIDAFPDTAFAGRVTKIGNSSMQNRTAAGSGQDDAVDFEVRILLESPPEGIRPDLSCTADIVTDRRSDALAIPIIALTLQDTADLGAGWRSFTPASPVLDRGVVEGVFVVEGGEASFRPIRVGIAGDSYFEVTRGLAEGDTVVSGSYQAIRELSHGDPVEIERLATLPGRGDGSEAAGAGDGGPAGTGGGPGGGDGRPAGTESGSSGEDGRPAGTGGGSGGGASTGRSPRPPGEGGPGAGTEYYVVVASARDSGGPARVVERLSAAGWAARLRRHRDRRNRLWWRAVVGPFEAEAEARARADSLRSDVEAEPWVNQVPAADSAGDAGSLR